MMRREKNKAIDFYGVKIYLRLRDRLKMVCGELLGTARRKNSQKDTARAVYFLNY